MRLRPIYLLYSICIYLDNVIKVHSSYDYTIFKCYTKLYLIKY